MDYQFLRVSLAIPLKKLLKRLTKLAAICGLLKLKYTRVAVVKLAV
jgi:hypothetical protein